MFMVVPLMESTMCFYYYLESYWFLNSVWLFHSMAPYNAFTTIYKVIGF